MDSASNPRARVKQEPLGEDINLAADDSIDENDPNIPIRFAANDIDKHLTSQFLSVSVRRFYSDNEWTRFSSEDRTYILQKALSYRDKNRSDTVAATVMDMSKPNPFADDDHGTEVWPDAAKTITFSENEKDVFRAVLWQAMYQKEAQRKCGDRFYKGKIKFSKRCSRCTDRQVVCVRKENGVSCKKCSEDRSSGINRCQHLEHFYVDYASRELNLELSISLALYKIVGGPSRTYVAQQKQNGISTTTRTSRSHKKRKRADIPPSQTISPSSSRTGQPVAVQPNSVEPQSSTSSQRRARARAKGPARGRQEPPPPRSPSTSPSPSIVEISRLSTPIPSVSTQSQARPPSKRQKLAPNKDSSSTASTQPAIAQSATNKQAAPAPMSRPEVEKIRRENQLLRQHFETLRLLSQTYYHRISDIHNLLEISTPPLLSALEDVPDVVHPFVEQREKLHTVSLEFRKDLMAIDKEVEDIHDTISM